MKELIERASSISPSRRLYRLKHDRKEDYFYADDDLQKFLKKHAGEKHDIQRYKGLGEIKESSLAVKAAIERASRAGAEPKLHWLADSYDREEVLQLHRKVRQQVRQAAGLG
jgi:DNA gyrase/topoisomerase IV subunit B